MVATCEKISEAYLIPVLKEMIEAFPFVILGIHADNGSESINYQVAKLLKKLSIELTKSRPRHSNDNALAESKNASVVRKHLGYAHIPQVFSKEVNTFCREPAIQHILKKEAEFRSTDKKPCQIEIWRTGLSRVSGG
ncbi:MAG: hypothetical protein M0041_01995, partial [Nitrospiraceae bacterium]|nr:hypothetical protein [Nitrospiraceae bacterium]